MVFLLFNWVRVFDSYMSGYRGSPPILTSIALIVLPIVVHKLASRSD